MESERKRERVSDMTARRDRIKLLSLTIEIEDQRCQPLEQDQCLE